MPDRQSNRPSTAVEPEALACDYFAGKPSLKVTHIELLAP
jgi:hypothetical protein